MHFTKLKPMKAPKHFRLTWPNASEHCYDCGSKWANRHTPDCDFTEEGNVLDLPAIPGTQWVDHRKITDPATPAPTA